MLTAYILIETAPGSAGRVAEALRSLPLVRKVHAVTGPFDVICEVEAPALADIGRGVVDAIQSVAGVARTLTCLAVDH